MALDLVSNTRSSALVNKSNNKSMFQTTLQHLGMYIDTEMDHSSDLVSIYRDLEAPNIKSPPEDIPKREDGSMSDLAKALWTTNPISY